MASKYITHDANARNSKKMLRMREKLGPVDGLAAYGIYWMLIERLREEEDYTSDRDYDMLAFDFRCDKELLRSVVEDFGLFDLSPDGKTFGSHGLEERMEVMEARTAAGKKGAARRWNKDIENSPEMAQNGKIDDLPSKNDSKTDGNIINKTKINKTKINKSFSSFPSSPFVEEGSQEGKEEEREKEKILYSFTFDNNWAAPNEEYRKFREFNKSRWATLDSEQREAYAGLWHRSDEAAPRFPKDFLSVWKKVYDTVLASAPLAVRLSALSDYVNFKCHKGTLLLYVDAQLNNYLEEHIDELKPIMWPFISSKGCKTMQYVLPNKKQQP